MKIILTSGDIIKNVARIRFYPGHNGPMLVMFDEQRKEILPPLNPENMERIDNDDVEGIHFPQKSPNQDTNNKSAIQIVDEEINKVIQGAVDLDRDVCEADLICARINIVRRIREES